MALMGNDTDAEGDALQLRIVAGPAHGAVSVNADGTVTYLPMANMERLGQFHLRSQRWAA